jgi:hypothetical protein
MRWVEAKSMAKRGEGGVYGAGRDEICWCAKKKKKKVRRA